MEGKASQSGTVSGPAAAKREVRRMIRERVGGLDAAAREAMSRSICRRVSSLVREKNFRRVAVFAARPGEVDLLSLLDLLPDREWYFPLVYAITGNWWRAAGAYANPVRTARNCMRGKWI